VRDALIRELLLGVLPLLLPRLDALGGDKVLEEEPGEVRTPLHSKSPEEPAPYRSGCEAIIGLAGCPGQGPPVEFVDGAHGDECAKVPEETSVNLGHVAPAGLHGTASRRVRRISLHGVSWAP